VRQAKKFDHRTGEKIKQKRRKAELIALLKARNVDVSATYLSSKEIEKLAQENAIEIEHEIEEVHLGWVNKPKGLLQILWDHGWIDPQEPLSQYTKDKHDMWLKWGITSRICIRFQKILSNLHSQQVSPILNMKSQDWSNWQ